MGLEILMATMHKKNISDIDWEYKQTNADILLINQADFDNSEVAGNIRMLSCKERGSSNSRNLALKNATGDICIIADDDVGYVDGMENIVLGAFEKYPDADIITFQIVTPEGNPFNSGYPSQPQWHNWRSILRCASIEIAFRRDVVLKAGLSLDTNFGLGSKYRVHDEIIFLKDAMDKGLKLLYLPIPIVIHPAESSGTDFNDHLVTSKGAAFVRLFGLKGMFFNLVFSLKKHSEYANRYSFIKFLMTMFQGSIKFIKEDKK
ncbi:glycosyltransferase family 2 protein [Vibrio cholerae]|nr:glycosyltransferase family 2 protein [Vibrio cholerae]ELV5030781.1 glycosyltransferase family 2 protein [Vibrio cholerae]HAS3166072.1 glycosyltransferase family 2 protein [Vibrio cholerae]